jgi:serine/threonine-protein kinase
MSPEQARGDLDSLGPASDVYALGATLYCLLTGRPPFEGDDLGAVLRRVQDGEFAPPRAIEPTVDGALEAVCLKAMARAPGDRYATPRAMAEDVERWMADEPVIAWREPWSRTLLRWLTRHRTGVTGAAAAGLAALVGLGAVAAVQAQANTELTRSKAAVQARYNLAVEAIKTFHTGVSEDFLLKEEKFKDLRDRLLKSASDFYGKLGALLVGQPDAASQQALAQANFEVAELTGRVGRIDDAIAAHRQVLVLREALASEPGAGLATKADVARSLIALGERLGERARTDESMKSYRRAEGLLAGLAQANPSATAVLAALGTCRNRLGWLLHSTGHPADALATLGRARDDLEAAAKPRRDATGEDQRELGRAYSSLGIVQAETGHPNAAMESYEKALEIRKRLVDERPDVGSFRLDLTRSYANIGILHSQRGRIAEALNSYRAMLPIQQDLVRENPAVVLFRDDLAYSHYLIGGLFLENGRYADALAPLEEARAMWEKLVDDNPMVTNLRCRLGLSWHALGKRLGQLFQTAKALAAAERALELLRAVLAENPTRIDFREFLSAAHNQLGNQLWSAGRHAEALEQFRQDLAITRKLADDNPTLTKFQNMIATAADNVAFCLSDAGQYSEAEELRRTAIATMQKLVAGDPADTRFAIQLANIRDNQGHTLQRMGQPEEALTARRAALEIRQKLADKNPDEPFFQRQVGKSLNNFGDLQTDEGHADGAIATFERARAIHEKLVDRHPGVAEYASGLGFSLSGLGRAHRRAGHSAEAAALLRRSIALWEGLPSVTPEARFGIGRNHAVLAGLVGESGAVSSRSDAPTEAREAIEALRRAFAAGHREAGTLRTSRDFDAIRKRPDFQLLLQDLAFPTDPFAH